MGGPRARMLGVPLTEASERLNILLPLPGRGQSYADLADRVVRALRSDPSVGHSLNKIGPGFVRMRYGTAAGDDVAWLVEEIGVLSVPTSPGLRRAVEALISAAVEGAEAWREVGEQVDRPGPSGYGASAQ
jgi:hypothetical protein